MDFVDIFFEMLAKFMLPIDLRNNFCFVFGVQVVIRYKLFGFLGLDNLSLFELLDYFDEFAH